MKNFLKDNRKKYNRIDKNKENLSPALKNTIGRLQTEYSQERINEQYGRY